MTRKTRFVPLRRFRSRSSAGTRPRGRRGRPQDRLKWGFLIIAMTLSVFGARLIQLQAVDPKSYAAMALADGTVNVVLPARRGDILDRAGQPLADSVEAKMIIADPEWTAPDAPALASLLAERLNVDYFRTLQALKAKNTNFRYIARRVPASLADEVLAEAREQKFKGLSSERDPARSYPAKDVAANLVGFLGTPDPVKGAQPLAGFERTFNKLLSGKDGSARFQQSGGRRIPLGENVVVKPVDGRDLTTTLDTDLQWFVQRVIRQTVEDYSAKSGFAIVMDSKTGEVLALADYPTFDATKPLEADEDDLGSRAMSDVYEPGSVQKALTMSALIDAGKVTPRTRLRVPSSLARQDRVIGDWFDHGDINLTLTGVLAKSSNIGTVLATDKMDAPDLRRYLTAFGKAPRPGSAYAGSRPASCRRGRCSPRRPRTAWHSASRSRSTDSRWLRRSTPSPTVGCMSHPA